MDKEAEAEISDRIVSEVVHPAHEAARIRLAFEFVERLETMSPDSTGTEFAAAVDNDIVWRVLCNDIRPGRTPSAATREAVSEVFRQSGSTTPNQRGLSTEDPF
jgi:hypothetical protein